MGRAPMEGGVHPGAVSGDQAIGCRIGYGGRMIVVNAEAAGGAGYEVRALSPTKARGDK